MELSRSADKANAIFTEKVEKLVEDQTIPENAAEKVKEAAKESVKEGKKEADVANAAYWYDKEFYQNVLRILGAAVIIAAIGGLTLAILGKEIPQFIVAIGTTALGAVAGILAPSPASKGG